MQNKRAAAQSLMTALPERKTMAITKTDFMRGMQCRRMLWLDKHRPGLRVIPPETQARLDAGIAAAHQIVGFLKDGIRKFQVNK